MIPRLLTILVTVPIIIICTYVGGLPFTILITALALLSLNEFYYLMSLKGMAPFFIIGNFFTISFIVFAQFTLKHPAWEPYAVGLLTGAAIVTFCSGVFYHKTSMATADMAITLVGLIYVGWLFSYLIYLREFTLHGAYLFFLMVAIWTYDVVAYMVGTKIGRIKLSPHISPKKTVEGAVAGFLTCVAVALIFGHLSRINVIHSAILGIIIGIVAPISDLVESLIKRDAGVKDSSLLVPGHGGVLDRMDSFILTAPVMYYYLSWFVKP